MRQLSKHICVHLERHEKSWARKRAGTIQTPPQQVNVEGQATRSAEKGSCYPLQIQIRTENQGEEHPMSLQLQFWAELSWVWHLTWFACQVPRPLQSRQERRRSRDRPRQHENWRTGPPNPRKNKIQKTPTLVEFYCNFRCRGDWFNLICLICFDFQHFWGEWRHNSDFPSI